MKIRNGKGKYWEREFATNLQIKRQTELSACQIYCSSDNVTKNISLSTKNFIDFRMSTLHERFKAHIGAVCTPWNKNIFITELNCLGVRTAFLHKYNTHYIYCDAVKYQIIGDIQAPLLATLPIEGTPNAQCFCSFNRPYCISVNKKAVSSLEIRICTDTGALFPFASFGRVVVQRHFRRHRSLL